MAILLIFIKEKLKIKFNMEKDSLFTSKIIKFFGNILVNLFKENDKVLVKRSTQKVSLIKANLKMTSSMGKVHKLHKREGKIPRQVSNHIS